MDYRKINSHIILLVIVIVFSVVIAWVLRRMIIERGFDAGTANIGFAIAIGVCGIIYLIIMATLANSIIPWIMKRLPEPKNNREITEEDLFEQDEVRNIHADLFPGLAIRDESEELDEIEPDMPASPAPSKPDWKEIHEKEIQYKLSLFLEYTHLTLGPYVTDEELKRLDDYIELFAR